jgi:ABC-type phosphate transport system substrate-binding protein
MKYVYLLIMVLLLGSCARPDNTEGDPVPTDSNHIETSQIKADEPKEPEESKEAEISEAPIINASNYPKVDGSTATLPLSQALYARITGADMEEAAEVIQHTKTTNAYFALMEKEADLLIVGEANEAIDSNAKERGVELLSKPIALDAFVFLVNGQNPVESLTIEQIVDIYSGKIVNWKELGGEDQPIAAFQRNEDAGSQTLMKELVMKGVPLMDAPKMVLYFMSETLEKIASYNNTANALGYSVYYYAGLMKQTPGLRFMALEDCVPSTETIQNGTYPLIAPYYAVIRADEPEDSPARILFNYMTSKEGQELVEELGYVPIPEEGTGLNQGENGDKQEEKDCKLPIEDDEMILLHIDEYSYILLDSHMQVLTKAEDMLWRDTRISLLPGQNVVIDIEPQIFYTDYALVDTSTGDDAKEEEGFSGNEYENWTAGLMDPLTGAWLLEPIYQDIYVMDKGIYGAVYESDGGTHTLLVVDREGKELFRDTGCKVVPMGFDGTPGCILKKDGLYGTDGQRKIADKEAMLVDMVMEKGYRINLAETGEVYKGYTAYRYKDWSGASMPWLDNRMLQEVYANGYERWTGIDDNSASILVDRKGNVVLDQQTFAKRNADIGIKKGKFYISEYHEETGQYLVQFLDADDQEVYGICQEDFLIERIYEEYPSLGFVQNGDTLEIEDKWTLEKAIITDLPIDKKIYSVVKLNDDRYYLEFLGHIKYLYDQGELIYLTDNHYDALFISDYGITFERGENIDFQYKTFHGFYNYQHKFLILPRDNESIVYYDNEVYCRNSEGYLTFLNYEGQLLLRVPLE